MGNKFIAKRIAALSVAGALMLSMPVVEEVTGSSISISASAASTCSTYSQDDLDRLISTHDAFVKKFGKSAYLYRVSTEKTTMRYTLEVQRALNYLARFFEINDDTPEDSKYGPDARALCRKVQRKLLILDDSYFGPGSYAATVAKLREILDSQDTSESAADNIEYVADAKDIFIHQTPTHCTAAACAMMLKNYLRINGISGWSSIDERTIRTGQASPSDTWNYGLLTDITMNRPGKSYDGLKIKQYALKGTASEKKEKIKLVLETNPEGVVLYGTKGGCHAVYMSYDMKILDPWYDDGGKYRDLSQSANSCSDSWSDITDYWVIVH